VHFASVLFRPFEEGLFEYVDAEFEEFFEELVLFATPEGQFSEDVEVLVVHVNVVGEGGDVFEEEKFGL
jgi:hypothetical protein